MSLTAEYVRSILEYDPQSGVLTWRTNRGRRAREGDQAGCNHRKGRTSVVYRDVVINKKAYLAHRLIMLMVNGYWPPEQVDHIDGNGLNNRIGNLRLVTNKENGRNQPRHCHNSSGHTGVTWHKQRKKWHAQIVVDGKRHHLGYFIDKNDAVEARKRAEGTYGFHQNHGRSEMQVM